MKRFLRISAVGDHDKVGSMRQLVGWGVFLHEFFGLSIPYQLASKISQKRNNHDLLIVVPAGLTVERVEGVLKQRYSFHEAKLNKDESFSVRLENNHTMRTSRGLTFIYSFCFVSPTQRVVELSRSNTEKAYAIFTPNRREPGLTDGEKANFDCEAQGMNYLERLLLGLYWWWENKTIFDTRASCLCCGTRTEAGRVPEVYSSQWPMTRRGEFMAVDYVEKLPPREKFLDSVRPVRLIG